MSPRVTRHFTASAFVTHRGRVLLLLHSEKRIWLPPGGHVEPDEAPAAAAQREVWEETGLRVEITSPCLPPEVAGAAPRPEASLEVEVEPGHIHLDLVYFARPAPVAPLPPLRPNEEAAELRWWSAEEVLAADPGGPLPPDVAALALRALAREAGTPL
jgi:8-oxo-dGTP pyrophosphatase MutT (NUDIX family)